MTNPEPRAKVKKRQYSQEEIDANKSNVYDSFDVDFVRNINDNLLHILMKTYFRPVYVGFDDMPERNNPDHPVILASNHSGMAFPWDAMVFGCGMYERFNYDPDKIFRPMVAPALSKAPVMHPFFMKGAWHCSGGVDATFFNFETMMHYPNGHLLIYPEGVPGIGKGFNRKYQLQRFATSFVRMSLKYKTDILPYSTVNAEYVVPFVYSFEVINKQFQKIGIPFMAIGIPTLFLIFPWAFYLALPCKMHFVKGKRISPYKWTEKAYEDLTEEEIRNFTERVKVQMQEDLNDAVDTYGKSPYNFGEWFRSMWKHRGLLPYNLPFFWPVIFHEFERQWITEGKWKTKEDVNVETGWGSFFKMVLRNPIVLTYFIPVIGWFFLVNRANKRWRNLDDFGHPISISENK